MTDSQLSSGSASACPFCGNQLTQKRGKVNPYARCETEDCFGSRCPVVNLDDPRALAAWNTRATAQPAVDGANTTDFDEYPYDDERFNRGVEHVVDLLAKTIKAPDTWHAGDGSEDYDEDLAETLRNILEARGLYDRDTGEYGHPAQRPSEPAAWMLTFPDGEICLTRQNPGEKSDALDIVITPLYVSPPALRNVIEECARAVEGEALFSATGMPEDNAYDQAIRDAAEAVRALVGHSMPSTDCVCDTNHPLFKERGHHPHCPVSSTSRDGAA